jgi:hypothetical protein
MTFSRGVTMLVIAFFGVVVRAEHFDISLTVEGDGRKAEAYADDSPPPEGLHPRPVFHARAGGLLTLQFLMDYVNPHDLDKQVTVRFFVVPEKQAGQKEVPAPDETAVVQGSFVMDFKPKSRLGLTQKFRVDRAGVYLLRLESVNSHSDHQHFSAIDLVIE